MAQYEDRKSKPFRIDGWGAPILGILTITMALLAIAATRAQATDAQANAACEDDSCLEERDGHRGFGHHRRGRGWFGRDRHDPEDTKEHMQYAAGWMMRRLDVEEPAREQIRARLDEAFEELHPLIAEHRAAKPLWLEAMLGKEGVDREALETQRQRTIENGDTAMRVVIDTMADISELLTPEQREKISERIRRHHH